MQELVPLYAPGEDGFNGAQCHLIARLVLIVGSTVREATECIQVYNNFVARVEELGLDKMVDMKPIIDASFCPVILHNFSAHI